MNKKSLIGLTIAGLSVVGISAIVTGVVLTSKQSKEAAAVPVAENPVVTETSYTVTVKNLAAQANKEISVFVKLASESAFPATASQKLTVSAEGKAAVNLSGLKASSKYDLELREGNKSLFSDKFETKAPVTTSPTTPQPVPNPQPVQPQAPTQPTNTTSVTTSNITDKSATLTFDNLSAFQGRKLYVEYKTSDADTTTPTKSTEKDLTAPNTTLTFELTGLTSNKTYTFELKANKTDTETDDVSIFKSSATTHFKTEQTKALIAVPLPTGLLISLEGLKDYEGRDLVISITKKPASAAAPTTPAQPAAGSPASSDAAAPKAETTSATTSSSPAPATTDKSILSLTGRVINGQLTVEAKELTSETDYEILVTTADQAKDIVFSSTTVKTFKKIEATSSNLAPSSAEIELSNLSQEWKTQTLIVKYALKTNELSEEVNLNEENAQTIETVLPNSINETSTKHKVVLKDLQPNKDYIFQVYFKGSPVSLLDAAKTFKTTSYVAVKPATTDAANPQLGPQSAQITFVDLGDYKSKELFVKFIDLDKSLTDSSAQSTSAQKIEESDTEKGFSLTGLDSEKNYRFNIYIKDTSLPLLREDGQFKSLKSIVLKLDKITDNNAQAVFTILDDYVGKKLKLQYQEITNPAPSVSPTSSGTDVAPAAAAASSDTWNDLSSSGTFEVSEANKTTHTINLEKTTFSPDKKWKLRVVLEEGSTVVVPPSTALEFQLPKLELKTATRKVSIKAEQLDNFKDKTLVVSYRLKTASTWTTFTPAEPTSLLITETNKSLDFAIENLTPNSDYDFKIETTDNAGNLYEIFTDSTNHKIFKTLSTPVLGTENVSTDKFDVVVTGLSDYQNKKLILQYRKVEEKPGAWTQFSDEKTVPAATDSSPSKVTFNVTSSSSSSSLEAGAEYEFKVLLKNDDNSTEELLQPQKITLASTAAAPVPSAPAGGSGGTAAADSSSSTPADSSGSAGTGSDTAAASPNSSSSGTSAS
ncbi:fibronectin type III domain-containing protein [Mycoplasma iguanae]|uniref:Fibronectin type III domain-containing protein n=1 Tax=Mycoplasma iguanae TaxID=292461 RepID=A0ABY5R8C9_9MOLU|nr:fibronectin type III domain-containing protein [Mycoplasma iguanae]UVD81758.1 fibronectin type III domain-containing protein [Mycoplasma iguanae]